MDQYHTHYNENSGRDFPPPPQRPQQGPPARSYRGGDSYRPQPPQSDFNFRNDASAPQYPRESDRYVPTNPRMHDRPHRNNNRRGNAPNNRGWGVRRPTAERPLLSSKRGHSPEDTLGQADAQNKAHRFMAADDVSDSDEEQMEESEDDQQQISDADQQAMLIATDRGELDNGELHDGPEGLEPPTKRRATAVNVKAAKEAASVPKWSNPDPYTVLPPVDETQRKRKDVVKIIRKARITAEKEAATQNQVATNDDFISFGLEADDLGEDRSGSPSPEPRSRDESGVQGAPTGPRAFSHLNNLHSSAADRAPGTSDPRPSANDLGPPPAWTNGSQLRPERVVNNVDLYPEHTEALGNRKRTVDDDLKGDSFPPTRRLRKPVSSGFVLQQWVPRGNTDPTPWIADDHRPTENAGFRLHKEICDFYEFVRPQKYEQMIREDLLERLQTAIKKLLPDCDLYCFGSFAAEMYLPDADMDLVVISSTFRTSGQRVACQTQGHMHKFAQFLEQAGVASHGSTQVIFGAKVPLIKLVDHMTGIQVDVSFENETGLVANETFNAWKQQFPAMPIITTLIKQFLKMRGLSEVVNGGLGGFSVTCLVTSLLQNLPRVQSGEFIPEQHLGEILIEFLDLYGNQFDLARTGISMNPPGYYDKQAAERSSYHRQVYSGNQASKLAIMDPNNPQNDISGGSKNVGVIFDLFSAAHGRIMEAMRSPRRISLLDWALGGDYRSFAIQRQRLQGLYHAKWGSFEASHTLNGIQVPDPSMQSGDGERQRSTSLVSGLPGSMFANPLDPNVIVKPKIKVPKGKKRRNAQKAQEKAPLTSNTPYRPQIRARKLKAEFPSKAMEIPDAVDKQASRTLLNKFKAEGLIPIHCTQSTNLAIHRRVTKEASGQTKSASHKSKKIKKVKPNLPPKPKPEPKPKPKPKQQGSKPKPRYRPNAHGVSAARLAETARNIGSATSFPIVIN